MGALRTLIKRGHRFVRGSDLYLFEVRAIVLAVMVVHAVDTCLVHVFPGVSTSQDIIYLFALKGHFVFELLFNDEDVGTGFAEKAEVIWGFLGEQDVGACRAKEHLSFST